MAWVFRSAPAAGADRSAPLAGVLLLTDGKPNDLDRYEGRYGVEETRQAVVIDPGDDTDRILTTLAGDRLTLVHIINTHGHFDHCGGAARVEELTGARIYHMFIMPGGVRDDLPEGWSLLQWINDEMRRHTPWKISIAEDLQGNDHQQDHRRQQESPQQRRAERARGGGLVLIAVPELQDESHRQTHDQDQGEGEDHQRPPAHEGHLVQEAREENRLGQVGLGHPSPGVGQLLAQGLELGLARLDALLEPVG